MPVEGRVSMETVFFKFPHWGTERVGGDEGNEKAKKERSFFPFCCHKTAVGTLGEPGINY